MLLSDRLLKLASDTSVVPLETTKVKLLLFTFLNPLAAGDDDIPDVLNAIEVMLIESGLAASYEVVWTVEPDSTSSMLAMEAGFTAPVVHVMTYPDGKIADVSAFPPGIEKINYILSRS